jgi:N-carbamoyl-L-amino-acid hydrolase
VAAESVRPAGRFDRELAELVDAVARRRGHEPLRLATVAAHDAISLAPLAPSVVVNVPSARGVCHHPDEYTAPEDLEEGAQVLLEVMWDLCRAGGESHLQGGNDGHRGSAVAGL